MAIRKILIIIGAVLLVFSFIASVHSQVLESSRLAFINSDTNIAEYETLQRTTGMNIKMSDQVSLAPGKELLVIAQSRDQIKAKIMKLSSDKEFIENQIEGCEKRIKDMTGKMLDDLEHNQLEYDQYVRKSGTDDTSAQKLHYIQDRKEKWELMINQEKRRLADFYEELKNVQNKLEQLTKP